MKNFMFSLKAAVLCAGLVIAGACGKPGLPKLEGIDGPFFNVMDGKIIITMKFTKFRIPGGASAIVPKLKQSTISFAPNQLDGGMMLELAIDADDLADLDLGAGDGQSLPDGRPIPGFPGGQMPNAIRIDTNFNLGGVLVDPSFYFSPKFLALYMPFGFDTYQLSAFYEVWIKGVNYGMLSIIGNEVATGRKAGGMITLRLEALKKPAVKRLLEHSRRNPHLKF